MAINSIGSASRSDYSMTEAPKGRAEVEGEEFSGAVAAADLVVALAGQRPVEAAKLGVPHQDQQVAAPSGGIQAAASGKLDRAVPGNAGGSSENASLIQKMAVSSNTGVDIAGLKPWSPDWVFEGGMNKHPSQKTLIEDPTRGGSAGALESLEQLLQQSGATMAGSPDGQMSAGGAMQMGAMTARGLPEARTLGSDDFVNVRQASMMSKQVKGAIGTEQVKGAIGTEQVKGAIGTEQVKGAIGTEQVKGAIGTEQVKGAIGTEQVKGAIGTEQVKGAIGTEQSIAMPGSGLKPPNAAEPGAELKDKKAKIPDTLGLIHPQGGKTEAPNNLPFGAGSAMKMEGSVVAGSMSQNRLNSESVGGIAQSIRELGKGGEVRIRLKPDHLGELHLKVMTGGKAGSEVGLQIHASDDRAKKILEESLGSLRESLAAQNLSLAKVDVQVAQPSNSANLGSDSNQDRPGLSGQQNFSSNSGDGSRGNSARDGSSGSDGASARSNLKAAPRQAAAFGAGGAPRAVASSRLDVIA
jgi:hypothetical protein